MRLKTLLISILGLTVPASASLSYQVTLASFTTQATVTDSLTVSSLENFTGVLTKFGTVSNDEYIDSITGVEFIAFNTSGTANVAFSSVSGGVLNTAANQGDSIKIVLPTGVYGIGFNFTTTHSTGDNLCVDTTVTGCSGNAFIAQNASAFVGALNDNPTPATFTTLWLHPQTGSPDTNLQSFAIATQDSAPEGATLLSLGAGLVILGALRRWRASVLS